MQGPLVRPNAGYGQFYSRSFLFQKCLEFNFEHLWLYGDRNFFIWIRFFAIFWFAALLFHLTVFFKKKFLTPFNPPICANRGGNFKEKIKIATFLEVFFNFKSFFKEEFFKFYYQKLVPEALHRVTPPSR